MEQEPSESRRGPYPSFSAGALGGDAGCKFVISVLGWCNLTKDGRGSIAVGGLHRGRFPEWGALFAESDGVGVGGQEGNLGSAHNLSREAIRRKTSDPDAQFVRAAPPDRPCTFRYFGGGTKRGAFASP